MIIEEASEYVPGWVLPDKKDWPRMQKILNEIADEFGMTSGCETYEDYLNNVDLIETGLKVSGAKFTRVKMSVDYLEQQLQARRLTLTNDNLRKILEAPFGPLKISEDLDIRGDLPPIDQTGT